MSYISTLSGAARPLTHEQVDANFTLLADYSFNVLGYMDSDVRLRVRARTSTAIDAEAISEAFRLAIEAANTSSGGIIFAPPGLYFLQNINTAAGIETASDIDNRAGIWVKYDNIHILGAPGATLTIINAANSHVVKFGQRAGATILVNNCSLRGFEIDGNKANQTTPDDTMFHNHGVDVCTGATGIVLEDLHIHDCNYYGIGFQRDTFSRCHVRRVLIEDTNADGLDWKGDTNVNYGNSVEDITIRRAGLVDFSTAQAALDLRLGIHANRIDIADLSGDVNGIRVQDGTNSNPTPIQPTRVENFRVLGSGGSASIGARSNTRYGSFRSGFVKSMAIGFQLNNPDARSSDLIAESNDTGFLLTQNLTASVEADTTTLVGLIARSNTDYGFDFSSVDELTLVGCDARNNGIGHHIDSGCTLVRIIGGSATGNSTNVDDSGTHTIIHGVSGVRTLQKILSDAIAIDSTGVKSVTFTHTLPFTPALDDVRLTLQRETNVGDWDCGWFWVTAVTSTTISAQVRVVTASATVAATVRLVATVTVKDTI